MFSNDVQRVRLVGRSERHTGSDTPLTTAAAVSEIERLSTLHAAGNLSEAEFTGLKAAVLQRI